MVNKINLQALAAALVLLAANALADTVTLKTGEKIVGKVTRDTATEVVIEERISASITDNRTIPKASVASVQKEATDEAPYQALKNVKPGVNSMPAASYDQMMKPLQAFIAQHPKSTHLAEIQANLTAFEAEKKRVDEGEVKLAGKWLSKEEAEKERYQVNAQVILNHMQDQQRRGDLVGALNTFDQLEQTYSGARVFPDAVDLAKQIIPAVQGAADRAGKTWAFQKAEREAGIQLLSEPQRSETVAANEREQKAADAAVEAATRLNSKWPPIVARSESALSAIASRATEESKRLATLEVSKMRESIKVAAEARKHLEAKAYDEAEAAITKSLALWATNESATRLQTEISASRSASPTPETASTEAEATPEATPTEGTPPVAAADGSIPADAAPADADESGEIVEEEEPSWFLTLPGIVTTIIVVILLLAAYTAFRKISKRANDVLE